MAVDTGPQSVGHHVNRALAGDRESFAELVRRYQGGVQGLAYHLTGNFADAQDVVQETFVTAYTRLDQLRSPERFGSWLRTIAQNECRARWRRQGATAPLGAEPADPARAADEEMERGERWAHVRRVLARLPEPSRLTLTLHYLSDWPYADIAEFLDVPVTTVVGRLHRARRLMQERLEPMVREAFQTERLADAHVAAVVAAAIENATQAKERWERATFLAHTDEALAALDPTSSDAEVARGRVEVLGMRGAARATWIGDVPGATQDYLQAIVTADESGQDEDAARLCSDLVVAYLRSGQYDAGTNAAEKARERFTALEDHAHAALMCAAMDLCVDAVGVWRWGEKGGFAMAGLPLRRDLSGLTFGVPETHREYTWGGPSPSAAVAWLLYPARVLGREVTVGESWEDTVSGRPGGDLLWALPEGEEFLARSTVESDGETVVTPAGRFTNCLRVRSNIGPSDGRVSAEYVGRHLAGVRVVWYAPGVGPVKARHECQNHEARTVMLTACSDRAGDDYFPLDVRREWRYTWSPPRPGSRGPVHYADTLRVVSSEPDVAYLSSATVGVSESPRAFRERAAETLPLEVASGDMVGEAAALEGCLRAADASEPKGGMLARLVEIYEALGRTSRAIDARWRLRETEAGLSPEQGLARAEELLAAAEAEGCWQARAKSTWLLGLALRELGRLDESQRALRASGAIAADAGDLVGAAGGESWPDRCLLEDAIPQDDVHGYANGDIRLLALDGGIGGGNSSTCMYHGYPPGPPGTPLTNFAMHGAYHGIQVLGKEAGATHSERSNVGTPWGGESMMVTSTLVETTASVTTPAGTFDDCALIESKQELHVGRGVDHPDRDRTVGYASATQWSWFAPGVGLVRALHEHDNGYVTDMHARSHDDGGGDGHTGLSVGSRWEYACVDEATGTEYEHYVRVAVKIRRTWLVVFATRATAHATG